MLSIQESDERVQNAVNRVQGHNFITFVLGLLLGFGLGGVVITLIFQKHVKTHVETIEKLEYKIMKMKRP